MSFAALAVALAATLVPAEPEPGVDNPPSAGPKLRPELLDDGSSNYRRTVDYAMEARLHPEERKITARARIRWRNEGSVAVRALWWHLYLNAFKNAQSTFIRESGGRLRNDEMKPGAWGWIEVRSMLARPMGTATATASYVDILPGRTFEHPDDDNVHDQTVMRTPLPFEVPPGGTVELQVEFTSKLPRVFARSGHRGSFHMVAQWFPKLGVLQETFRPPAEGEGVARDAYSEPQWNCHQYHAHSEFFADYGHFRVAMTVPKGYVVGATGRRESTVEGTDGTITYEHVQEGVHDFAWTADPRFVTVQRTFTDAEVRPEERAEVAELLGLDPTDLRLQDVEVKLLVQPEHAQYQERYLRSVFEALEWFGLWYGAYPYDVLTVVDGPRGAGGAMGMEYPTLITGGVSWPAPDRIARPEGVTVHEFGHQYWYGLVGSNEFEESWLDEGFNTYSTGKVLDRAYGPFVISPKVAQIPLYPWFSDLELSRRTLHRLGHMLSSDRDEVVRHSWGYLNRRSYGANSYSRPATVLAQLEVHVGPRIMAQAMRLYHLRWRYRHPTTEDFIAVVEEVSGRDLRSFFERTIHTAGHVDYGIERLKSDEVDVPAGIFDAPGAAPGEISHHEVTPEDAKAAKEATEGRYETEVLVVRHGDVPFAHTIEVGFSDGSTRSAVWDGRYRWHRLRFETEARAETARLYADRPMLLDVRPTNDTRVREANPRVGLTWGAHVLYAVQTLLQLLGGLL